jgi:hypothetical protein
VLALQLGGAGEGFRPPVAEPWHVPVNASAGALLPGVQRNGDTHAVTLARQHWPLLALMHSTLLLLPLPLLLLLHATLPGAHCVSKTGGLVLQVAPVAGQY